MDSGNVFNNSFLSEISANLQETYFWAENSSTLYLSHEESTQNFSLDISVGVGETTRVVNTTTQGYITNLAVVIPMGIGLYTLSLLTFIGNAMVLHAIRTERRLQTVSNMFIMSLAIADLTVGMFVMPISSAYAITGDWPFGIIVCQFWLSVDYSASTASILNLLILSIDRYWSINSPLKYIRKRTKKRALIMIGIVWLVSAMWIIPIISWHYWYNNGIRKQPDDVCETEFADNAMFKLTTSTANFYVPMVLMICLYAKIFSEIKKRSKFEIGKCNFRNKKKTCKIRNGRVPQKDYNNFILESKDTKTCNDDRKLKYVSYLSVSNLDGENPHHHHHHSCGMLQMEYLNDANCEQRLGGGSFRSRTSSVFPNLTTAVRGKLSRRTMDTNWRQQKKAARQLGVIMGAFVLCWLPYIITFMVTALCEDCINSVVHTVTIWLGYLNSTINPFLYALCNANFKRAFKTMFYHKNNTYGSSCSTKPEQLFA